MKFLSLSWAIFLAIVSMAAAQKRVVCYYGSWAGIIDSLNPSLCTHIIYSFMNIDLDGSVISLQNQVDFGAGGNLVKFRTLKARNPSVKLMVAFGGWSAGVANFQVVSSTAALRMATANNILKFANNYGFDGVDIDWEFPATSYRSQFVALLRDIRSVLSPNGKLLSVAVGATKTHVDEYYDVLNIAPQVDFINLMTYDLHAGWDDLSRTGNNAPLYASSVDVNDAQRQLNSDACVNYWIMQGAPRDKLVLGIPLYGQAFTLSSASNNGVGAPISSGAGQTPYKDICRNLIGGWTRKYDSQQQVPYAFSGTQWVGYDDVQSVGAKVDYIVSKSLGGAMFWSFEQDDVDGSCGGGKFPLISLAFNRLSVNGGGSGTATVATTASPVVASTAAPAVVATTKAAASGSVSCPQPTGIFPNPTSCTSFLNCDNGKAYVISCQAGLNFNAIIKACDYPANAPCSGLKAITTLAPATVAPTAAPTLPPITTVIAQTTTKAVVTAPPTLAPTAAITTKAAASGVCGGKVGLVPNPADCTTFYNCNANGVGALMNCGPGLAFNPTLSVCDWKANVPGCV